MWHTEPILHGRTVRHTAYRAFCLAAAAAARRAMYNDCDTLAQRGEHS